MSYPLRPFDEASQSCRVSSHHYSIYLSVLLAVWPHVRVVVVNLVVIDDDGGSGGGGDSWTSFFSLVIIIQSDFIPFVFETVY